MSEDKRYQHVKETLKAMGEGTAQEVHAALQPTPYSEREVHEGFDQRNC